MHFPGVVHVHERVELVLGPVEGEAQVTDASGGLFLKEKVDHAVFHIAFAVGFFAAPADSMEQVIVKVVRLELLEGLMVHLDGGLGALVAKVGQFGGDEVAAARMPAQGLSGGFFALALQVGGGGVKVIDAMLQRIVHHFVYGLLVDDVFPVGILYHGPAHAAKAQGAHFVTVYRVLPHEHLLRAFFRHARPRSGIFGRAGRRYRRCAAYLKKISSIHRFVNSAFPLSYRAKRVYLHVHIGHSP